MTTMSTTMMAVLYLACGLVCTTLAVDAADHFSRRQPVPHRTAYAVVFGLLWPVVLIGLVQLGVIVAVARHISRSRLRTSSRPHSPSISNPSSRCTRSNRRRRCG